MLVRIIREDFKELLDSLVLGEVFLNAAVFDEPSVFIGQRIHYGVVILGLDDGGCRKPVDLFSVSVPHNVGYFELFHLNFSFTFWACRAESG